MHISFRTNYLLFNNIINTFVFRLLGNHHAHQYFVALHICLISINIRLKTSRYIGSFIILHYRHFFLDFLGGSDLSFGLI